MKMKIRHTKKWLEIPLHHALIKRLGVKVGPPVHNYEHEAGSYGDGFT